jgi:hypothetical protein
LGKEAAALNTAREGVDRSNEAKKTANDEHGWTLKHMLKQVAGILGSANAIKISNDAELKAADRMIADLSRERVALDSKTAELSGKLARMQERVAFLSDPERLHDNRLALKAAMTDLDKATADLEQNLADIDAITTNRDALQAAVDTLNVSMGAADAKSRHESDASKKAYAGLEAVQGRHAAAQLFASQKKALEESLAAARRAEKEAKARLDEASIKAAGSDSDPRLHMCTQDYANKKAAALQAEADLKRKQVEEAAAQARKAAADQAERDRLAREQAETKRKQEEAAAQARKAAADQAERDRLAREQAETKRKQEEAAAQARKCNPDACNRVLDSYNSKNWSYVSSSFGECAGCPVVNDPKRIPGGSFNAPQPPPPPAPKPPPPPPPPPPAPVNAWFIDKIGFSINGPKNTKNFDSGRSMQDVINLCKAQCDNTSGCKTATVNNPKTGSYTCWYGDAKTQNWVQVPRDSRWWAGVKR